MNDLKASKKEDPISIWGFWVTVSGFFIRSITHWLTPVHELMHAIPVALLGGKVTSIEQTRIWFTLPSPGLSSLVVLLGFWLEMLLYWSIGMLWPRSYVGKAAAGIMPAVALYGLRSEDFRLIRGIYPANMLLFALVGTLLTIALVSRHLANPEVAGRRTVVSTGTVRRARN